MKKHILYITLALLSLSYQSLWSQEEALDPVKSWESTDAKWSEITDYEGRFRVTSPEAFTLKTDTVNTAIGALVYHTFYLAPQKDNAENEVYMVSYTDYPEGAIHPDSTALITELFEETQDAAVNSVRGELLFSQEGFQNKLPFRYWRIDYLNGNASIRTKAYVDVDRFYIVQTVTKRKYGMNYSTDRFIDSFRIFTE